MLLNAWTEYVMLYAAMCCFLCICVCVCWIISSFLRPKNELLRSNVVCFSREHHTHARIYCMVNNNKMVYHSIDSVSLACCLAVSRSPYFAKILRTPPKKFISVALDIRITFSFTCHVSNCIHMQFLKRNILLLKENIWIVYASVRIYCSIKLIYTIFIYRCDNFEQSQLNGLL